MARAAALALAATLTSSLALAQATPPPSINSTSQDRAWSLYTPVPQQAFTNDGKHRIFVSNDLGMHCSDVDQRISSILPPFNVLHAQVLTKGVKPLLLDSSTVGVVYSASSNPNDPALAKGRVLTSVGGINKSDFWQAPLAYAPFYPNSLLALYFPPGQPRPDIGLPVVDAERLYLGDGKLALRQQTLPSVTGVTYDANGVPTSVAASPYVANAPQPVNAFEAAYPMFTTFPFGYVANNTNWFSAEGIPMAPFDDYGRENPFPLLRVQAVDKTTGATLASLDTVTPVSSETNCKNCHLPPPYGNGWATERLTGAKIPSDDPAHTTKLVWASQKWAADVNILMLHDLMHGTTLFQGYDATTGLAANPVVCQTCHYTPALDLAQVGPQDGHGLQQTTHETMSRVMHNSHGVLMRNGARVFPLMAPPNSPLRVNTTTGVLNAYTKAVLTRTCYQCHPGNRTQCLRGVMFEGAGAVCQDCHGQMTQVGRDFSVNLPRGHFIVGADYYKNRKTPRVPWLNEPTCGSCHTGDAVSNLTKTAGAIPASDAIRLLQAYLATDPTATPILPANMRFAEPRVATGAAAGNPQLFRLSVDTHGGVFCEGCHGATHAEWPVLNPAANDNVTATQLQGHAGVVMECDACHTGALGATLSGPHGMHPVGAAFSATWVSQHGDYVESHGRSTCQACHGLSGEGTVLSKVAVARTGLRCESGALCSGGRITLPAGYQVTCTTCHGAGGGAATGRKASLAP